MAAYKDDHEERIAKLAAARRELEDSLLVMTHLEAAQSRLIRSLAERQAERDHFERTHLLRMSVFDDQLNTLIDRMGRQQGGMEIRLSIG